MDDLGEVDDLAHCGREHTRFDRGMARKRQNGQRAMVYVDGFNLYYGCLKDSPNRWLDLDALCRRMLRDDAEIVGIKYFTAKVKPRVTNPN